MPQNGRLVTTRRHDLLISADYAHPWILPQAVEMHGTQIKLFIANHLRAKILACTQVQ